MFEIEHGMLALSLMSRTADLSMTCTGGGKDSVWPSAGTKDATRQKWLMCPCKVRAGTGQDRPSQPKGLDQGLVTASRALVPPLRGGVFETLTWLIPVTYQSAGGELEKRHTFAGGQYDTFGRQQCDVSLRSSAKKSLRSTTDANSRAPQAWPQIWTRTVPNTKEHGLLLKALTAYDEGTRSRRQTAKRGTKPQDGPRRSTLR